MMSMGADNCGSHINPEFQRNRQPLKAILVVAARPNLIKIRPVLDGLEQLGVECTLVHTGQHYDANLSDVFFTELGIRPPDEHLNAGSGSHAEQSGHVMIAFEAVVNRLQPDAVVVVGDVNSTMSCALVGAKNGAVVVHVEAGLRSRDWSMPEEINRVVADRVSDLLLAPSADAMENLRAEGYRADQIHLVGNVMIDTLMANIERARERTILTQLGVTAGSFGLVTLHRPSNVDEPTRLQSILDALAEIADDLPLIFPVHPRTRARLSQQDLSPCIVPIDPLGYLDFIALQDGAALVLTDSGGVQEETTMLGTPCLTLRESTERPATVEEGTNTVVGTKHNVIVNTAKSVLAGNFTKRHPELWDGEAGKRCARVIVDRLTIGPHFRPTDQVLD